VRREPATPWSVHLCCLAASLLLGGFPSAASAQSGHDDTLIQASNGWHWVGHQQSDLTFITCDGTVIDITPRDKIEHRGSCEASRAALRFGVERALSLFASMEGRGMVRLNGEVSAMNKYALASWVGSGGKSGKSGHAILVNDGTLWHVLVFGSLDVKEALARGVPREILTSLIAASNR